MPALITLRYRYTQFFILFMLGSFIYVMIQNVAVGITDFQGNFYNKNTLIGNVNMLRIILGDKVFPAALLGEDGWMEYVGENNIDDFQNTETFKNKKEFVRELTTLVQYLNSQEITLLIVVAPNKASIYPDKIPGQIEALSIQSRFDGVITYLENNNLPVMVDLRPALQAARQNQDVYYKTDTHWNGYGALVAYSTIINTFGSSYPDLKPYAATDLELVIAEPGVRDIPNTMQINFIKETDFFFAPKKLFVQTTYPGGHLDYNQFSWIPDSKLPTLLMFHDSFGAAYLNNYLSMNFGRSHFIQIQSMPKYLTRESIQQFKPDIIIIEIVERNLHLLPEYFPGFILE